MINLIIIVIKKKKFQPNPFGLGWTLVIVLVTLDIFLTIMVS